MKKNWMKIGLILAALLAVLTVSASAANATLVKIGDAELSSSKPYYHNGTDGAAGTADNIADGANASFDVTTGTLTLNGLNVNANVCASSNGDDDLKVKLQGANTINTTSDYGLGISYGTGDITISGEGSLTVNAGIRAIYSEGTVTIDSGTVTASATGGGAIGIVGAKGVVINDGRVTATGAAHGIDCFGSAVITVNGGTVIAESKNTNNQAFLKEVYVSKVYKYRTANSGDYTNMTTQQKWTGAYYEIVVETDAEAIVPAHIHDSTTYTELTAWTQLATAGSYYLGDTIPEVDGNITVSADVTLCLNSKTLNLGEHRIEVSSGAALNICDCRSTQGKITRTSTDSDTTLSISGGSVNIFNGTVERCGDLGAAVSATDSTVTVSGGQVLSGNLGISCKGSSVVYISGGTVSAKHYGIDQNGSGAVHISGGTVTSPDGYGVCIEETLYLSGTPTISGDSSCADLYLNSANVYAHNEGNTVPYSGGELKISFYSTTYAVDTVIVHDVTDANKDKFKENYTDYTLTLGTGENADDLILTKAHIHTWSAAWSTSDTHHWHNCSADGCTVTENSDKDGYGEHSYTDEADATCNDCGYVRTVVAPEPPEHIHVWASAWSSNSTHHWHDCSADGCTVTENSGKDGYAAHTVVTDAAVDATCTTEGKTAGTHCSVCQKVLTAQQTVSALKHDFGTWVSADDANHTRTCSRNDEHTETAAHTYTDSADTTCDDCGYVRTVDTPEEEPEYPDYWYPDYWYPDYDDEPVKPSKPEKPVQPEEPEKPAQPEKPELSVPGSCEGDGDCPCGEYHDLDNGEWYHDGIDFVLENNLMNGTDKGFEPALPTSRAMIWTVLARMDGVDTSVGESWDTVGKQWAMEKGITDGTAAGESITREMLATMLWRMAGEPYVGVFTLSDLSVWSDCYDVSEWAQESMAWALSNGIINGKDGLLQPRIAASRAEVAAMLMRFVAAQEP